MAFGVVLLLVGLGAGVSIGWLAWQSTDGITLGGAGLSVTVLPVTLFAAGVGSLLLLWIGARVIGAGARRRRARRDEVRRLRYDQPRTPSAPPPAPGRTSIP